MNTSNIGEKSVSAPLENVREVLEPRLQGERPELLKVTDSSSLSSLLPRLQNLASAIHNPGDNVMDSLADNVTRLQDAFVDALYSAANSADIDLSEKLTLRLNSEDKLVVMGEHPQKGDLENLFGAKAELSQAFKEISTQSQLLKDMNNIGKIIGVPKDGFTSYQSTLNREMENTYQLSIKGEMSHFYFSR